MQIRRHVAVFIGLFEKGGFYVTVILTAKNKLIHLEIIIMNFMVYTFQRCSRIFKRNISKFIGTPPLPLYIDFSETLGYR